MAYASQNQMRNLLRGMIGDKLLFHQPLWFTDEDLDDRLDLALLRHKPNLSLSTLPREETIILCYRAAIDICYELAARNAPFSIVNIEGMSVDKTGVMQNWLNLADRYEELYRVEINGGLGSEGVIFQGELVRHSLTTGRQTPGYQTRPADPPLLTLVTISGRSISFAWTPFRDQDFYSYEIYRKDGTGDFALVTTIFNVLDYTYTDTPTNAGHYEYKITVKRGLLVNRTYNYPALLPSLIMYLNTDSNTLPVDIS
jgi:hypothetical protein